VAKDRGHVAGFDMNSIELLQSTIRYLSFMLL
jgi:hypothetical protein